MRNGEVDHFMERTWAALFTTRTQSFYCHSLNDSSRPPSFMPGAKKCERRKVRHAVAQ